MWIFSAASPLPPPETIRQAALDVVSRPHYQLEIEPSGESLPLWLQVLQWIARPIFGLFRYLDGLPDILSWAIVIVATLLFLAVVGQIIYWLISALRGFPDRRVRDRTVSGSVLINPEELERESELSGSRGDYLDAVRLLFRACLVRIEIADNKTFRPGITNHDLLRQYRSTPLFEWLEPMVETIETKWYGGHVCTQADYNECRNDHARILEYVKRPSDAVGS